MRLKHEDPIVPGAGTIARMLSFPRPVRPRKSLLIVVGLVVVAASIFADYKWRQWIAARRRERQ